MPNGISGRNKAIILAGLAALAVGAGIIAFLLFTGGEEPSQTAATTPVGGEAPATTPDTTATTIDSGSGPGTGPQQTSGTAQTQVFLPGVTPLPPAQLGPLPVLPWQEDGLDELEAQVAESLAAIEQADPATAHALADLPWLADEMLLSEAAAVFLVQEMGSIDPALARRVADLPDLSEQQLADDTVTTLLHLQDLVRADAETARQLLETPWLADGVDPADQATLAIVGGIASEDPALARHVADAQEIADGITNAELAALTGSDNYFLERLERDFPDIAEIVRGYSWVSGGISRNPQNNGSGVLAYPLAQDTNEEWWQSVGLSVLDSIARLDPSLGRLLASYPWVADGFTTLEVSTLISIEFIAKEGPDTSLAVSLATLPWVADGPEGFELIPVKLVQTYVSAGHRGTWPGYEMATLLLSQPWFRESSRDGNAIIKVLWSVSLPVDYVRELIENAQVRSEVFSRPRGGIELFVVQRPSVGQIDDSVLQDLRAAVAAIEDFMDIPWPGGNVTLYLEPEFQALEDIAGAYINLSGPYIGELRRIVVGLVPGSDAFRGVLYHELGHYYFSQTHFPLWMSEGAAQTFEAYTFFASENASLQSRYDQTDRFIANACTPRGSGNIYQWQFNGGPRYCAYPLGERLLLALHNNLGQDMLASSMRELYVKEKWEWKGPRLKWRLTAARSEEAIYQAFLSNTPPELQEEFKEIYKLLHGRPELVPVEVGGETIELPGNLADNPQVIALAALYVATNGANWTRQANWFSPVHLAEWEGVTTDKEGEEGNVISLSLGHNQLTGSIPPELGNLSSLRDLNLVGNNLTGPIPPELGNLANLAHLELGTNRLSGNIPPELGRLSNLQWLALDNNRLSGPIPPELGSLPNLRWLALGSNQLTGPVPLALADLARADGLVVSSNHLCWPGELADLAATGSDRLELPICGEAPPPTPQPQATVVSPGVAGGQGDAAGDRAALIALYNATDGPNWVNNANWATDAPLDQWHGVWLTDAGRVGGLGLESNLLTGPIPPELGNLTELRHLYLTYSLLTGPVPPELGNLGNLTHLGLDGNRLTGQIPGELGNLASLEYLHMRENEFTGPIPPELARLQNLESLDLAWNQLSGPIPGVLGNLASLDYLQLSNNRFTGSIPPELGNLPNLDRIFLFDNQLTGCVPAALAAVEGMDMSELPPC